MSMKVVTTVSIDARLLSSLRELKHEFRMESMNDLILKLTELGEQEVKRRSSKN